MPVGNAIVDVDAAEIYGVAFIGTNGTRTNASKNLGIGKQGTVTNYGYMDNDGAITSVFDDKEIYKDIVDADDYGTQLNVTESGITKNGTPYTGNVFVKIPKFYISKSVDANGNFTYKISKYKKDNNYYLPYSFQKEDGTELPYVLIGKYLASLSNDVNKKLESKPLKVPLVSQKMYALRTYAKNNGSGYQLMDIHAIDLIQTLFYNEFATLDSQSIMAGFTHTANPQKINNGQTDSIKNSLFNISGFKTSNSTGTYAMKYRGIENFYGNISQFVDGINIQNNIAYVSVKPSTYASDVFTGDYSAVGYTNATANGHVSKMGFDSNKPYVNLPFAVDATTELGFYNDYYYQALGNKEARFGGSWKSGSQAGVSCWQLHITSEYAYTDDGSRLIKKAL